MTSKSASTAAFAAAILFAAMFVSFGLPRAIAFDQLRAWLGVLSHAMLFPVVAALVAPAWARVGGYAWAAGDIILNVATLNGAAPFEQVMAFRYGLHVCAALWLLAVAWANRGALRAGSAALAVALGGFSFVAPYVPAQALYPVMVLVVLWLALAGWRLGRVSPGSPSPRPRAQDA